MLLFPCITATDIVDYTTDVFLFGSQAKCRIFVVFPKIAQSSVNGSTLTIESMNLTDPTADGFYLSLSSKLENTGPISASLDPMSLSLLSMDGQLLGNISTPQINASPSGTEVDISQFFQIIDMAAFNKFTSGLLKNSTASFQVHGQTTLRALGQKTQVTLTKAVNMTGNFVQRNAYNRT